MDFEDQSLIDAGVRTGNINISTEYMSTEENINREKQGTLEESEGRKGPHSHAQNDEDEEPPLSPIVGYPIMSSEDEKETGKWVSDSSEFSDSETATQLKQLNATLKSDTDEPNTPRRKRQRKRVSRKWKEEAGGEENKRPRLFESEDVGADTGANKEMEKSPPFLGFKTASGKHVEISDEAIKKAKGLFNDVDLNTDKEMMEVVQQEISPKFEGFKTASGKHVEISEEAIKKARGIFNDVDLNTDKEMMEIVQQEISPKFEGFKTASGKQVKVSQEAMKKAAAILKDAVVDIEKEMAIEVEIVQPPPPKKSLPKRQSYGKFKPPTRIAPVPKPVPPPAPVSSSQAPGMSQEVMDCIAAFLADDDDEGFS